MAVGAMEREAILNAIRVLRKRRVRPSGEKIAWFLRRENLVNEEKTVEALDELVRSSDIMKVEYKGAISYRLANSKLKTSKPKLATLDNHAVRRAIFEAIAECGPSGGTRHRIAARLTANGFARIVDRLDVILQREARAGGIARFSEIVDGKTVHMFATVKQFNQNNDDRLSSDTECNEVPDSGNPAPFQHLQLQLKMLERQKNGSRSESPSDFPSKTDDSCDSIGSSLEASDEKMSEIESTPVESPDVSIPNTPVPVETPVETPVQTPENETRTPVSKRGRPRKLKPAFDEEFYVTDLRRPSQRMKRARKVFDPSEHENGMKKNFSQISGCVVCHGLIKEIELLCCCECLMKAHPTCLGYTKELAEKCAKQDWLCMDCKLCTICGMDHTVTTMIFCDKCDRAFHCTCHQPPLDSYPVGTWVCFYCLPKNPSNFYDSLPPSPEPKEIVKIQAIQEEDKPVPNIRGWSVDQLVAWFDEQGLAEYSHVFREQEIDGVSALLLERPQVLNHLGLKFGPAVKIYMKIRALQCGTWDVNF